MRLPVRTKYKRSISLTEMLQSVFCCVVLGTVLSSCAPLTPNAGPAQTRLAPTVDQLTSQFVEIEKRGGLRKSDYKAAETGNVQLWFPVVAGHFFGTANAETSWPAALDKESKFELPADDIAAKLETMALPFDARETGVLLEPETVRVARLQAFANSEFTGEPIGETQWHNADTGQPMMLVYFDRPCRLLGSLFRQDAEYRFDVSIPAAGLYWLQAKRMRLFGPTTFTVRRDAASALLVVKKSPL